MTTTLSINDLSVIYDGYYALNAVSISVEKGQSFGLVGESGSGKSTLLRAVAGLAPVSEGTIRIDGETLKGAKRSKSFYARCRWCFRTLTGRCIRARRSTGCFSNPC